MFEIASLSSGKHIDEAVLVSLVWNGRAIPRFEYRNYRLWCLGHRASPDIYLLRYPIPEDLAHSFTAWGSSISLGLSQVGLFWSE